MVVLYTHWNVNMDVIVLVTYTKVLAMSKSVFHAPFNYKGHIWTNLQYCHIVIRCKTSFLSVWGITSVQLKLLNNILKVTKHKEVSCCFHLFLMFQLIRNHGKATMGL